MRERSHKLKVISFYLRALCQELLGEVFGEVF